MFNEEIDMIQIYFENLKILLLREFDLILSDILLWGYLKIKFTVYGNI
jgi:hypothetical protein